jgi:RNA polymerase sigma-70 factor (ECF subfamily)
MVAGDATAFGQLFERYYPAVCRYLSVRMAADAVEDVAAETFLVAWRRQSELPANPLPWLLNTAAKCSSNQRRALSRSAALVERLGAAVPSAVWIDDRLVQHAQRRALLSALAELSPGDRELLLLRHWDALAPHEIAAALGISRVVARARLSRAQRRLQRTLDAALRTEDLRPPCPVSTTPSAS